MLRLALTRIYLKLKAREIIIIIIVINLEESFFLSDPPFK